MRTAIAFAFVAVVVAACPPADTTARCNSNDDCLVATPLCVDGVCVPEDVAEGEGEGALGEGEGDVGEGEGALGEGEGTSVGEGEGEGSVLVDVIAPLDAPVGVTFFASTDAVGACAAKLDGTDIAAFTGPGGAPLVLGATGTHVITMECGGTVATTTIEGWALDIHTTFPQTIAAGASFSLAFDVVGTPASVPSCLLDLVSLSNNAPSDEIGSAVSAPTTSLSIGESSALTLTCQAQGPPTSVALGSVVVVPAVPGVLFVVTAGPPVVHFAVVTAAADACALFDVDSGDKLAETLRTTKGQTSFVVDFAGQPGALRETTNVVCSAPGASSSAIGSVVVTTGDVTSQAGFDALVNTQVLLGNIAILAPSSITSGALAAVAGNVDLACNGSTSLPDVSLPALTSVTGAFAVEDCGATGFGVDVSSLNGVGRLQVTGTSAVALHFPSLRTVAGNVDILNNSALGALDVSGLVVVTGHFDVRDNPALSCPDVDAFLCQIVPSMPAGLVDISNNGGTDCAPPPGCVQ